MIDVVYARKEVLDLQTNIRKVLVADSPDQLMDDGTAYVVLEDQQLDSYFKRDDCTLYIPYRRVKPEYTSYAGLSVYFDLENYPFFRKLAAEIRAQRKGVLRFRRLTNQEYHSAVMAEDLYVLSAVFGAPEQVTVFQSSKQTTPVHVILTVDFGAGTMAHLEYTFAKGERIELEWSGAKTILEFNSEEMNPFLPNHHSSLPLVLSVDSIIEHAHKLNPDFLARLKKFDALVKGGREE